MFNETPKLPTSDSLEITFKNAPRLSEHEADHKFNERRVRLSSEVEGLLGRQETLQGKEVSVEYAQKGVSSLVCFVEADAEKYVLKIPLSLMEGNGEAQFLQEWERVGVSVPRVLDGGRIGDHPYVFMEFVDAPSLSDAIAEGSARQGVHLEMGAALARMHAPKAEGFGRIVNERPQFATFREWLESDDIKKRVQAVREGGLLNDEHGRIDKAIDALLSYAGDGTDSSFCHFDFSEPNILATDPITVFDPSPMLNHGIIDIGRSALSPVWAGDFASQSELIEGYFGSGLQFDAGALQASILLNAYWKFPYQHKLGRTAEMGRVREYLAKNSHLV